MFGRPCAGSRAVQSSKPYFPPSAVSDSMDDMDDNEALRRWYKYHRPEYLDNPVARTDTSSRGKRGKCLLLLMCLSCATIYVCMVITL